MGLAIVLLVIVLLFLRVPLFATLGIGTALCWAFIAGDTPRYMPKDMFEVGDNEVFLAIPFFILAGSIATAGKIAERLTDLAKAALGFVPGGLAISAVMACVFFAAISGSSPVTVIAIGTMMYPALIKEKYPEGFSVGLLTSAGSLGIIIPPSIPMILYAIIAGAALDPVRADMRAQGLYYPDVQGLFIAGVGPGLLIALFLGVYAFANGLLMRRGDGGGGGEARPRRPLLERLTAYVLGCLRALWRGIWALLLPAIILGGIYTGWYTATQAAAVSVLYALVVELFIHREIKVREVARHFVETTVLMGTVFVIIVIAGSFNKFLAIQEVPQEAALALQGFVSTRWQFLLMVNILLLVVGCLMDIMSAILILAPLLAPIAVQYGVDPIHFGIIFIVNLEIGYLTPPMGINLFVASSIFNVPLVRVIRAALPYILIMAVALGIVTAWPRLTLFLVDRLAAQATGG